MSTTRKSARKTATKTAVAKIPQPHGGALHAGGVPGNVGGTGRPPSVIRDRLRGSFDQRVATLEQIADGEAMVKVKLPDGTETQSLTSAPLPDRLKAIDMLAKYGLGSKDEASGFLPAQALQFVRIYEAWLDRNLAPELAARARVEIRAELKAEGL